MSWKDGGEWHSKQGEEKEIRQAWVLIKGHAHEVGSECLGSTKSGNADNALIRSWTMQVVAQLDTKLMEMEVLYKQVRCKT